jgi:hypothetical protein
LSAATRDSANYFSNLTRIDGATGKAAAMSTPSQFHTPSVSRNGGRCCFAVMEELFCQDLATGRMDHLEHIGPEQLDWGHDDQLMLGATQSDLVMVDFTRRSIRKVATLGRYRFFRFLPGGTRIYLYNAGASLLDLQDRTRTEIYGPKTTVTNFALVPGRSDIFMTTIEAGEKTGAYWIEVPSAAGEERLPAIRR